jgi:hypothetical protein
MKSIIRFALLSMLTVAFFSCNKTTVLPANDYMSENPTIKSKIYPYVVQPYEMTLGKSGSIFRTGDKVIIFLPYQVANDEIVSAQATVSNAVSQEIIGTYDLIFSTDPNLGELQVPAELEGTKFMIAVLPIDDAYKTKLVNISTHITGGKTNSSDELINAFGVEE